MKHLAEIIVVIMWIVAICIHAYAVYRFDNSTTVDDVIANESRLQACETYEVALMCVTIMVAMCFWI